MTKKAGKIDLPWVKQVDYNKLQGQGRLIVSKFYHTAAWRKTRSTFIRTFPLCALCEENGITTIATVVDHIQQINPRNAFDTMNGKYGHPLDWENLQSLCEKCHNTKSAKERWKN